MPSLPSQMTAGILDARTSDQTSIAAVNVHGTITFACLSTPAGVSPYKGAENAGQVKAGSEEL